MSSPAFDELQQRLQRIEQNLNQVGILLVPSEINAGIKQAIVLTTVYADSALASARKVLDFIASDLYRREFKKNPGTQPLENKLRELEKAGKLPRRLAAYAANVRELGNIGAHGNPTEVTAEDVVSSLENLMKLVAWYCEQVRPSSASEPPVAGGPKVEAAEAAPVGPAVAPSIPPAVPPAMPPVPTAAAGDGRYDSSAAQTEPPALMLVLPRAGEDWTAGSRQNIVWVLLSGADAPPVEGTTIELCVGSGQRVMVIAAEAQSFQEPSRNRASYLWEVPENLMPGSAYSIRVTIRDRAGQTGSAISANFSVRAKAAPFAPPPLPYPPPPPPANAVGPRLFSTAQMIVSTLLAIQAGPLLLALNYFRIGEKRRGIVTIVLTLIASIVLEGMGPPVVLMGMPGALVMWWCARKLQGAALDEQRRVRGKNGSWLLGIGAGLAILFLQLDAFDAFR
ncbi:MAG TPA: DUF4145 domain-containing protein [Bryobacteraceae bacterium]|jgi:hypothetical protein